MEDEQVWLQTKKLLSVQKNKMQKNKQNEKTPYIMEKHLQIIYLIRN